MYKFSDWKSPLKISIGVGLICSVGLVFISIIAISPSGSVTSDATSITENKTVNVTNETGTAKYSFDEFYTWATTRMESLFSQTTGGGNQDDFQERMSYFNSQCRISEDYDNDGAKDIYYDKSCLVDKYKDYLNPTAFEYGSSKENGSTWLCPPENEKYYSYICSRYGDLFTQTTAAKLTGAGFKVAEEYGMAEKIYQEVASDK